MSVDITAAVQRLVDEHDITKLVVTFSLAMDARDLELFRSVWADEIDLALPPLAGDAVPMVGAQRADDYASGVIGLLSEFDATQHVSTNHLVTVAGDTATCTCYTLAQHRMAVDDGEPWYTAGARYDLHARRIADGGWRFDRFRLTPLWWRGNERLWKVAAQRLHSS